MESKEGKMLRIGKHNTDNYQWGILHDLYHKTLLYVPEYINITYSSVVTDPPVLRTDSCFQIYKTRTVTAHGNSSGNNVINPGDSIENMESELAYTPEDQIYTWASTNIWSTFVVNSTWYMFSYGAEDDSTDSLGKSYIGFATTIDFYYDFSKGGVPYSTNNYRALAKFFVSSASTVSRLGVFENRVEYVANGLKTVNTNSTASSNYLYRCMEGTTFTAHTTAVLSTAIYYYVGFETPILPNDVITLEITSTYNSTNAGFTWIDYKYFTGSNIKGLRNFITPVTFNRHGVGWNIVDDYTVQLLFQTYSGNNGGASISWATGDLARWRMKKTSR